MADNKNAAPFHRTRSDHAQETAEDYVEAIAEIVLAKERCRIVDLAKRFGVAHVTVIKIIQRLEGEGLVSTEPYRPVELTPKGRRLAKVCRERHELVFKFLLALGVSESVAANDTEGMEHHLSPETLKRMKAFLDR